MDVIQWVKLGLLGLQLTLLGLQIRFKRHELIIPIIIITMVIILI